MLPKIATKKQRLVFKYGMKPIPGFLGRYSIREDGVVISHRREGDRVIRGSEDSIGYLIVTLGRLGKSYKVAGLVAEAFIGPRPPGKQINHKDGVKRNNAASNLEYVSGSENCRHRNKNWLTNSQGESHHSSVFTWEQVQRIRRSKKSAREIAAEFSVNPTSIYKIRNWRTWKHAPKVRY